MGKLFRNKKAVLYAIIAFVIALVSLFAIQARAEQTLELEAGYAMLRGETPTLGFNIACKECGPVRTDYEFGFELMGASEYYRDNPNVIQLHAQLVDGWKKFEMGLGFYYLNQPVEYTCEFGFHLLARYRFNDRIAMQWRHSSSAGSCVPNAGRDLLTFAIRLGPRQ